MTHHAYEMQKFTPRKSRFFYAQQILAAVMFALALILFSVLLTGCDSAAAVGANEADARRDLAAVAMCGPDAAPIQIDNSTFECLKEKP